MKSIDWLFEFLSFSGGELIGARPEHSSDNVWIRPVLFELPFLNTLSLIFGILSQNEITQLELLGPNLLVVTFQHALLISSEMIECFLAVFIQ